jgi:transposase
MLTKEDFAMLKALATRGVYQKDIAAQLGVHPKTVSRALQRGTAPAGPRPPRGSKLDPFKAQIDQLLADGIWNSVVILRRLQAAGYTGSSTILREYIAPKRLLRAGRATVRFETPPASNSNPIGAKSSPWWPANRPKSISSSTNSAIAAVSTSGAPPTAMPNIPMRA